MQIFFMKNENIRMKNLEHTSLFEQRNHSSEMIFIDPLKNLAIHLELLFILKLRHRNIILYNTFKIKERFDAKSLKLSLFSIHGMIQGV